MAEQPDRAPASGPWQQQSSAARVEPPASLPPLHIAHAASLDRPTPGATPAFFAGPTPKSIFGAAPAALSTPHKGAAEAAQHGDSSKRPRGQALPAEAQVSARSAKQVNGLLKRAATTQELFAVVAKEWQLMDAINLTCALNRLAKLMDEAGDACAFRQQHLAGNATFAWLLENLQTACCCTGFGSQCTMNAFSAIAKLQCGSPELSAALLQPLLRCLCSPADRPPPYAVSGLAWALAKNIANDKQCFLAAKGYLFALIWEYTALFDAQSLSNLFWAFLEFTQAMNPMELCLETEAPSMLHYLATAAQQQCHSFCFQGISNIIYSCGKMQPPFRHPGLLEALSFAALHRLHAGVEYPSPQAVGNIAYGLGKLNYVPQCLAAGNGYISLLDQLGGMLCSSLSYAKPLEITNYLYGCGLLGYSPPHWVLQSLLAHLATPGGGQPSASPTSLEGFSNQELSNFVGSVLRFLAEGSNGRQGSQGPAEVELAFLARFDAIFLARLSATSPMSPQHVANLALALSRLPAAYHASAPSAATLEAIQRHFLQHAAEYNAQALSNLVRFLAGRGYALPSETAAAICSHAVRLMDQGSAAMPLMSISMVVWALGMLRLPPTALAPFLERYMHHVHRLLEEQHGGPDQQLMHPGDAARLAWGTAALAGQGLLLGVACSEFWGALAGCMDTALRYCPQVEAAVLFKPEELRMLKSALQALEASCPGQTFLVPPGPLEHALRSA